MTGQNDPNKYLPRFLDSTLAELLKSFPAIMVVGPRAVGKSTTAGKMVTQIVRLDNPSESAVFEADPDRALDKARTPVLLDEWQVVPELMGAVKRAVDSKSIPGQFLMTGSIRAPWKSGSWPGTGRVIMIRQYGVTIRELERNIPHTLFLDQVGTGAIEDIFVEMGNCPSLFDYIDLLLMSGFPAPLLSSDINDRDRWLQSYVDHAINRDIDFLSSRRDSKRLRAYLTAYSYCSGQVVDTKTLCESAGIDQKTGVAYEQLFSDLFLIEELPAYFNNRLSSLVKAPKRFIVDAGLAASVLRLNSESLMRRGNLIGPLLETFVVSQLRAELSSIKSNVELFHLRTFGGSHEIDVVADYGSKLVGLEIKAKAAPSLADARHLIWLRDQTGPDFVAGIVLHTGTANIRLDDRIYALPICALWDSKPSTSKTSSN